MKGYTNIQQNDLYNYTFDKYENERNDKKSFKTERVKQCSCETSLNAHANNFEIPILENNTYPSAIYTKR